MLDILINKDIPINRDIPISIGYPYLYEVPCIGVPLYRCTSIYRGALYRRFAVPLYRGIPIYWESLYRRTMDEMGNGERDMGNREGECEMRMWNGDGFSCSQEIL